MAGEQNESAEKPQNVRKGDEANESNSDAKRRRLQAKNPDTWVCFGGPVIRAFIPHCL